MYLYDYLEQPECNGVHLGENNSVFVGSSHLFTTYWYEVTGKRDHQLFIIINIDYNDI